MYGPGFRRHPLEKGTEQLLVQPMLGRDEKGAHVLITAGQPGLYSVLALSEMGLIMSSFVVPLILLCSPFVHSKSFESIDFVDYDSGTDIGWNESECGRLWSDYFDRHVQLGSAFSIAHGKFRLYYLIK